MAINTESIEREYRKRCETPSDIYQHLPTLKRYASECNCVTEFGVRTIVSSWAFLSGLTARVKDCYPWLTSVDPIHPADAGGDLAALESAANEACIGFVFIQADDRNITIEFTDLLFIDTWHVYEQLKAELALHAGKARKYIILHDTETFGVNGNAEGHRGLKPALDEFLKNPRWRVREHFTHCNGLTILERDPAWCPRCATRLQDGICRNYGCEHEYGDTLKRGHQTK